MCTVLLPPGVNPIWFNKHIISYRIIRFSFPSGFFLQVFRLIICIKKINLSLSTLWRHKGGQAPLVLNLGTRSGQLNTPAALPPLRNPGTRSAEGGLGPRIGLDDSGERKTSRLYRDSKFGASYPSVVAITNTPSLLCKILYMFITRGVLHALRFHVTLFEHPINVYCRVVIT
jgi:hypothetical protein